MTSRALLTALYGHCCTPDTLLAFSFRAWASAISVAPPPGTRRGSTRTLRTTCMASCKFLSTCHALPWSTPHTRINNTLTSLRMSLLAPRKTIVHALGSLHFIKYVKYSSPIFLTSKRPQPVPTSLSCSSSVLLHMTAPHALQPPYQHHNSHTHHSTHSYLAMRLLSIFLSLRMAVMLCFMRKC